jgi:hypothetical protein
MLVFLFHLWQAIFGSSHSIPFWLSCSGSDTALATVKQTGQTICICEANYFNATNAGQAPCEPCTGGSSRSPFFSLSSVLFLACFFFVIFFAYSFPLLFIRFLYVQKLYFFSFQLSFQLSPSFFSFSLFSCSSSPFPLHPLSPSSLSLTHTHSHTLPSTGTISDPGSTSCRAGPGQIGGTCRTYSLLFSSCFL